jgi:hypothetical protein
LVTEPTTDPTASVTDPTALVTDPSGFWTGEDVAWDTDPADEPGPVSVETVAVTSGSAEGG